MGGQIFDILFYLQLLSLSASISEPSTRAKSAKTNAVASLEW